MNIMKRSALLFTVFLAFALDNAIAAELSGDMLLMCDRPHEPSAAVTLSQSGVTTATALARGDFEAALEAVATKYESTLSNADKARPEVVRFLAALRQGSLKTTQSFQINPSLSEIGQEVLFEGSNAPITFNCNSLSQREVDMAASALAAARVISARDIPALRARAKAVAVADKQHTDLLTNGLAMWPWENWLNGKRLGDSDADPLFTRQIVFMRPSLGIEVNTRSREAANLEGTLIVEPIGIVQYTSEDYSKWWGVSLIVTSTTRQGAGYGVLARYGSYSLGLTRHASKVDNSPDDTFLLFSVDLYNMFQSKRAEIPEMREKIKKLGGGLFSK